MELSRKKLKMKRTVKLPHNGGLYLNWYRLVLFVSVFTVCTVYGADPCYRHLIQSSSTLPKTDFFYSGVVASKNVRECSDVCNGFVPLKSTDMSAPKQSINLHKLCFCSSKTQGLTSDVATCQMNSCDSLNQSCSLEGYKYNLISAGPPTFEKSSIMEVGVSSNIKIMDTTSDLTSIKYDFGDEYKYRSNKTNVLHKYSTSGYFLLKAVVINNVISETTISEFQEVIPNNNVSNIEFYTPDSFETGIPSVNVTLSVGYGLNLDLTIKMIFTPYFEQSTAYDKVIDEVLTDSFALPVGIAITDDEPTVNAPSGENLIVSPSLFFFESGSVTSFEFYPVATGIMTAYILRPINCCQIGSTSLLNGTGHFDPDLTPVKFTVIKVVMLDVKVTGFQLYDLDTNQIKVEKGDALGILSPASANIKFVNKEMYSASVTGSQLQEGSTTSASFKRQSNLPYIRPYLTKTYRHKLQVDLTTEKRIGNLTLEVHNGSTSTVLTSKTVPVLGRITNITLHNLSASYEAVNTTVSIKAMIEDRDRPDTSYVITLSNLSQSVNSSDGYANFYRAKWKTGTYHIVVVASNLVNSYTKNFTFMIESMIKKFELIIPTKKIVKDVEFSLTFKIEGGTNIKFFVNFDDDTGVEKKYLPRAQGQHVVKHTYTKCGEYNITAYVENLATPKKESKPYRAENYCKVKDVEVATNPKKSGNKITLSIKDKLELQIKIGSGSKAVYFIDWGDGENVIEKVKDYNPKVKTFKHQYKNLSIYNITGNVSNEINTVNFTSIEVKLQNCSEPAVVEFPYGTQTKPIVFTIGQEMEFVAAWSFEDTSCRDKVDKNMHDFKCFLSKDGISKEITGSSVSDGYKCVVNPKTQNLEIAPYKLTFQLSYGKDKKIFKYDGYINITESELVAIISNGESRQIPSMRKPTREGNPTFYEAVIDGSESFDPDDKEDKTNNGVSYTWKCKNNTILRSEYTLCNSPNGAYLELNAETKCNGTTDVTIKRSSVEINTECLELRAFYSITLEFLKTNKRGKRKSIATQRLEIMEGEPPDVGLSCVTNCNGKINSRERFVMKYNCETCFGRRLEAKWNITQKTSGEVVNFGDDSSTGANLVVSNGTLAEGIEFRFKLTTNFVGASKKSSVELIRKTSKKPHGGYCKVDKDKGMASVTKFTISCQDWTSEDEDDRPTKYEFRYDMDGTGSDLPLLNPDSLTRPAVSNVLLPQGLKEKDYHIALKIRIINQYGTFAEYNKLKVKVEQFKPQFSGGKGEKNETGKKSDSAEAQIKEVFASLKDNKPKNENDTQAVTAYVTSVVSVVKDLPLPKEQPLAPTAAKGLFGEMETTSEEDKERLEKQKKAQQEEKTKFKDDMVNLLKKAPVNNIQQLKAVADSLSTVTADKDTVSEDTQGNAIDMLVKMQNVLSQASNTVGADYLEQSTKNYVQSISNLFQVEKPVHETIAKEKKTEKEKIETIEEKSENKTIVEEKEEEKARKKAKKTESNVKRLVNTLDNYFEVISKNKVTGEKPSRGKTDSFDFALKKINADYFENVTVESEDIDESGVPYGFQLPNMTGLFANFSGKDIQLENVNFKKNIFSWDLNRSADVKTELTSLKIKTSQQKINVSYLAEPITITIKNKPELLKPLNVSLFLPGDLAFNETEVDVDDCNMLINFDFLNDPENVTTFYVYIQYGKVAFHDDYDVKLKISRSDGIEMTVNSWANSTNIGEYSVNGTCNETRGNDIVPRTVHAYLIDKWTIMLHNFNDFHWAECHRKKLYFTYYYEGPMPKRRFESNIYTDDEIEYRGAFNYSVKSFCSECAYWNENASKWMSDGCKVNPNTTSLSKTTCLCDHLTSFGGFYVAPNPLPPLTLDRLKEGYVLLVTVGTILLLYIVGLVVARRADKNDLKKIGVCPLLDNNPEDKYLYEITVNTGSRRNAGTKSNVFFNASGDICDSGVHHLTDPEREVFQTNSSDVFIMSTPNTIGDINYIRVWHDNTGGGWYLRSIEVIDLQTEEKFLFITTRWLAVDKHDGTIDAIIPVCGKEELTDFNYLFTNKSKRELSDAHIWFSIYARPPRSSFTRCQRLSVAISLLFCSMLASCMFYRAKPKGPVQEENRIGGFSFRWEQVFVALIGACITVPVNLILVGLFRIINPSPVPSKVVETATASDTSINNPDDASDPMYSSGSTKLIEGNEKKKMKKRKVDEEKKRKKAFYLPYWCIYPTWCLCIGVILGSGFFVVWYGMAFGNKKSLEWLASVTICLFQDILLIQPLKVFAMALFIALIVKKLDEEEKSELEKNVKTLSKNESWLHKLRNEGTIFDRVEVIEPPDLSVLENMRGVRLKEMKMAAISREMMLYFLFTLVVFMIGYNLRDQNAYNQTLDIKELFKLSVRNPDSKLFKTNEVFSKLQSYQEFWNWTDVVLLPELYPKNWYNLSAELNQSKKFGNFPGRIYLNDLNSKIVNGVRLRQMRVREDSCKKAPDVKNFINIDCADAFSTYNEEKRGFDFNWSKPIGSYKTRLNQINKPWRYQDSSSLDTYLVMANLNSYVGGGYVVELFPKFKNKEILDILKAKQWIDRHTRALIVEFATYNAQTNYFDMVMIVFEFPPSGGLVHYSSVQTFRLSQYTNETAFFVIGCYILYLLFMVVFTIREIRIIYRVGLKYFREFWNLVEMGNILLSLAGIFVYFYLNYLRKVLLSRLPHKVPNVFINFHWASMWYDGLIHIIALICFFVTLKFIKILRFNKRISMLSSTLKVAWYPLAMFAIMFFIIIAAVVFSATIIFGHTLYGYRNWLATASAVFSLLLGKFSYYQFESTNIILGPIFFFSFNIMVNWIIMNMFISILNDVFACVQAEILEQENEYEMFDYMMGQIKGWLGFKTRFAETERSADEYFDAKINRAVMSSDTSLNYSKPKRSGSENSLNKSQHWRAEKLFVDDSKFLMEEDVSEKFVDETVDKFVKCINMLYFNDANAGKRVSNFAKSEMKDN